MLKEWSCRQIVPHTSEKPSQTNGERDAGPVVVAYLLILMWKTELWLALYRHSSAGSSISLSHD